MIGSTRAALATLQSRPELRRLLWANAERLYQRLLELGFSLGPEPSPVVAVVTGGVAEALALWGALLQQGVYVNLVLPPATPGSSPLVRCSVSAAHTREQIDAIGEAFAAAAASRGDANGEDV